MSENVTTEKPNLSFLGSTLIEDESLETMISVDHVSMIFNMASEQLNNLKEYAIALARRELRFKEFRALDDVSLTVKRGDVFGIMGTNGSGKSTLLKIIAGVLDPTHGSCTINGSIAPLIELGAGFDIELTARENIYLNGALLGYTKEFIEEHFDEIVAFAEIEPFLDMPLKNYSSGMVARVAFAIATATVPDILIVDEVLSVGDYMFQQKCEARIDSLIKEHGVTVLIVSHDNDLIRRICNKAIWIEKGHTRMIGYAEDVCEIYHLIGGRPGSIESEKLVLSLLEREDELTLDRTTTIDADSRSSFSVRMAEEIFDTLDKVILTSEDSHADNLVATYYASFEDLPIFMTSTANLSDITYRYLQQHRPKEVILMGSSSKLKDRIEELAATEIPSIEKVTVIDAVSCRQLALDVYELTKQKGWQSSNSAMLAYEQCTGDLTSMAGYIHKLHVPVFFNVSNAMIDEDTKRVVAEDFDHVAVLGAELQFPTKLLKSFLPESTRISRIEGIGPYDANRKICDWLDEEYRLAGVELPTNFVVASFMKPENTYNIGYYASHKNAHVIINDPIDLDGVAWAIRTIEKRKTPTSTITFAGNENLYSKRDKLIVAAALGDLPE